MLVLSRKVGEVIKIGSSVEITVLSFDRGVVRLGVEAPRDIAVHRKEVFDRMFEFNKKSSKADPVSLRNILNETGLVFDVSDTDNLEDVTSKYKHV